MFQSIKVSIAKKLDNPKFRNVILKERIRVKTEKIIKEILGAPDMKLDSYFDIDYDLKTKILRIYIKNQRILTNLEFEKLNIIKKIAKVFDKEDFVKRIHILKKFSK